MFTGRFNTPFMQEKIHSRSRRKRMRRRRILEKVICQSGPKPRFRKQL